MRRSARLPCKAGHFERATSLTRNTSTLTDPPSDSDAGIASKSRSARAHLRLSSITVIRNSTTRRRECALKPKKSTQDTRVPRQCFAQQKLSIELYLSEHDSLIGSSLMPAPWSRLKFLFMGRRTAGDGAGQASHWAAQYRCMTIQMASAVAWEPSAVGFMPSGIT